MKPATTLTFDPPRARLTLVGEVDAFGCLKLRPVLADAVNAGCAHFTVDASSVSFIDAGGLGTLVWLRNAVRPYGGTVQVCAASAPFRRAAGIVGLEPAFGLDQTLPSARWPRTTRGVRHRLVPRARNRRPA